MKTIRMDFSNTWWTPEGFTVDYFLRCFPYLRPHYQFVLDRDDPELVFYSVYGYIEKLAPRAIRLIWAGEAGDHFAQGGKMRPGVNQPGFFHYGITMAWDNTHENHIYMPLCCLHLPLHNSGMSDLVRRPGAVPVRKEYFCNFICSNGNARRRVEFFQKLSQYKRVESLGAVERNNDALVGTGHDTAGYRAKQAFQARCKFSIAFENSYFPGYTTEKLSDPLLAGSVPIYSGNPHVAEIFNPRAFINVDEFASDEEAIEHIQAVDNDDALYQSYLDEPPFPGNSIPSRISDETYLNFFRRVLG